MTNLKLLSKGHTLEASFAFVRVNLLLKKKRKIFTTKKNEQKSVPETAMAVNFQSYCDFKRRIGDTAIENAIDIVTDHCLNRP